MSTPAEKASAKKLAAGRKLRKPTPPKESPVWLTTLRQERERLHLSLRDVASGVGLSVAAYWRIERGYADPCLTTVRRICKYFGTDVYRLWEREVKGAS